MMKCASSITALIAASISRWYRRYWCLRAMSSIGRSGGGHAGAPPPEGARVDHRHAVRQDLVDDEGLVRGGDEEAVVGARQRLAGAAGERAVLARRRNHRHVGIVVIDARALGLEQLDQLQARALADVVNV